MNWSLLLLVLAASCVTHCTAKKKAPAEDPVVEIEDGKVLGQTLFSRKNRSFFSFRGIPYAKPPLGELRFKAPEKPDPWKGIYKAQSNPPQCIQKNYFVYAKPEVQGSEDCLYLNVYTPQLRPQGKRYKNGFPVMVAIHWGGFIAGSSQSDYLGPEYLMDKDVVLVTFNYRLGALGFLSTGDDESPGNYGLKDQVAVLQWVQDNIRVFGGDKNKVTIFGASAGAGSVHFHVLSPASRGLFHRAIAESGNAFAPWANPIPGTEMMIAQGQAQLLGCQNVNSSASVVECLRNVNATALVEGADKFKFFSIDPIVIFLPSIEAKTVRNPKPFLCKSPLDYIKRREINKVPFMIGVDRDEGLVRAGGLLRQSETRRALNQKFDELMPQLLALAYAVPKDKVAFVWDKLKQFYFEGASSIDIDNPKHIQGMTDIYSDRSFFYSVYQAVQMHARYGHKDLWFYHFNYKGENSYGDIFATPVEDDVQFKWGVSHCDELLYLFKSPSLFSNLTNKNDIKMTEIMTKIWTNFADFGNPTPAEYSNRDGIWPKVDAKQRQNFKYLNITGTASKTDSISLTIDNEFYKDRMSFWKSLPLLENIDELQ